MRKNLAKHYVYEWVRPDCDVVFYVGKGSARRAWNFKRNKHTNDVISFLYKNGLKPSVRIIARFVNEDSAYEYEEERIAFWQPLGELTNELPGGRNGGGGMTGKTHSSETKEKISAGNKNKIISLETRRKLRFNNLGKKASPETCAKMSTSHIGRVVSTETRVKTGKSVSRTKNTPEGKAKSKAASLESQNRPEVKLKKSLAISAAKNNKPNHWTKRLSEMDLWHIGTLIYSVSEISKKYDIPETAVAKIRRDVEKKLGVSFRPNRGGAGRIVKDEERLKASKSRQAFWDNKSPEERIALGKKMSEGRAKAKALREQGLI
jgi:hypothetical protein